jgi:hypothetical protein
VQADRPGFTAGAAFCQRPVILLQAVAVHAALAVEAAVCALAALRAKAEDTTFAIDHVGSGLDCFPAIVAFAGGRVDWHDHSGKE